MGTLVSSKREEKEYEGTHKKNCCDEITWEKILYKKDKNGAEDSLVFAAEASKQQH